MSYVNEGDLQKFSATNDSQYTVCMHLLNIDWMKFGDLTINIVVLAMLLVY